MADNADSLQAMLNVVTNYARLYRFAFNIDTSNVVQQLVMVHQNLHYLVMFLTVLVFTSI